MKRKAYLAALVMCMALAVNGCGSDKETSTGSDNTATEQQTTDCLLYTSPSPRDA